MNKRDKIIIREIKRIAKNIDSTNKCETDLELNIIIDYCKDLLK